MHLLHFLLTSPVTGQTKGKIDIRHVILSSAAVGGQILCSFVRFLHIAFLIEFALEICLNPARERVLVKCQVATDVKDADAHVKVH